MMHDERALGLLLQFVEGAPRNAAGLPEYLESEQTKAILAEPREVRLAMLHRIAGASGVMALVGRQARQGLRQNLNTPEARLAGQILMSAAAERLAKAILRSDVSLTVEEVTRLLETALEGADDHDGFAGLRFFRASYLVQVVDAAEAALAGAPPGAALHAVMTRFANSINPGTGGSSQRILARLFRLMNQESPKPGEASARSREKARAPSGDEPVSPAQLEAMRDLMNQLAQEWREQRGGNWFLGSTGPVGRKVATLSREESGALILAMTEGGPTANKGVRFALNPLKWRANTDATLNQYARQKVLEQAFRRRPRFMAEEWNQVLDWATPSDKPVQFVPYAAIVATLKAQYASSAPPEALTGPLWKMSRLLAGGVREQQRLAAQIEKLCGREVVPELDPGEAWMAALIAALGALPAGAREPAKSLVAHGYLATTSKPSQKWLGRAAALVKEIGHDHAEKLFAATLEAVGNRGTIGHTIEFNREVEYTLIGEKHVDLLRGLAWAASVLPDARMAKSVGDAGEMCLKKIPGHGARCPKVANACLESLSRMGTAGAAQISRLRSRAKTASARGQVAKALRAVATKAGVTTDELEELAVPTFDMAEPGVLRRQVGSCTAEVRVMGVETQVRWLDVSGKAVKSPPAAMKRDAAGEIKAVRRVATDMAKLLTPLRDRIERAPLDQRRWAFEPWRQRYLDHPLVAGLARRLIWIFARGETSIAGAWLDGRLVDVDDRPIEALDPASTVELWHPIARPVDELVAWRRWLERHEVTQPFKQAHREVYLLTDAERHTVDYSNRFAAHIVRQHQMAQLAAQRGWRCALMGGFDGGEPPSLDLPRWGLRVEFFAMSSADLGGRDEDMSPAGIALTLSTDRVHFQRGGAPVPLAEIPPLVFSEVMRDVDLFVGVCSIGNDPNWTPGGHANPHEAYWHSVSFGDLSAVAQTRREVLDRLIPRLKIAPRCTLTEKFLVVRGDLRTYKIHLGSGNILMEPNDQYLCIVPGGKSGDGARAGNIFLPFEGDRTLSIILSKAILLAEDAKIKDASILRQINHVARA